MSTIPNPPTNTSDEDYPCFMQSVVINIATKLAVTAGNTVHTDPKLLAEWSVDCAKEIIKRSRES